MSFTHNYKPGVTIRDMHLTYCPECETLRVVEPERTRYIRRTSDESRIREQEPPCIKLERFRPPA